MKPRWQHYSPDMEVGDIVQIEGVKTQVVIEKVTTKKNIVFSLKDNNECRYTYVYTGKFSVVNAEEIDALCSEFNYSWHSLNVGHNWLVLLFDEKNLDFSAYLGRHRGLFSVIGSSKDGQWITVAAHSARLALTNFVHKYHQLCK